MAAELLNAVAYKVWCNECKVHIPNSFQLWPADAAEMYREAHNWARHSEEGDKAGERLERIKAEMEEV